MIEHIQPEGLFPSARFGFTQVVTSPPGKLVFVSGQVAWDRDLTLVGGDDLATQAEKALENLRTALAAAGAQASDVTALRVYIVNYQAEDAAKLGAPFARFFDGLEPPASTWIGVQSLAAPGLRIEIEASAVVQT
jgi:enamine deaminase RidA (YjgF/YER057c/UK114 family)